MQENKPIELSNFNMGGLSDSPWSGKPNSMRDLVGLDFHSIPGLVQVRQKLIKETDPNSNVNEYCLVQIACSNGKSYHCSSESGKIWERDSVGTYTLAYTITAETGAVYIMGSKEYNHYLYIATQDRLHRIPVSGLSNWAANIQLNWAALNLGQEDLGGTGFTYTTPASISESATARQTFTAFNSPIQDISVNLGAIGTGDVTVSIHDSSNTLLGSKTITHASLTTGWNIFTFSSNLSALVGEEYHVHVTSTVADTTVVSSVTSDLEGGNIRVYTTSDATYHPFYELNGILFIGDKNYVHQVENNPSQQIYDVFSNRALDVNAPLIIKTFGNFGTDLLIGTTINNNINSTKCYRWDTYSVSYFSSDPIPEVGINAFLQSDNYCFVQCGLQGNIYIYDGDKLQLYYKIPGTYSTTSYGSVNPNAVGNLAGLVLFGFSNGAGDPTKQGVYVLGRNSRDYPIILDLSFPISERSNGSDDTSFVFTGVEIGSVLVLGNDVLVSWRHASNKGIDKLDYTTKLNGAFMTSRYMMVSREKKLTISEISVPYYQIPSSCDITIQTEVNYSGTYASKTSQDDTDRKIKIVPGDIEEFSVFSERVIFTSYQNTAPAIESVITKIK